MDAGPADAGRRQSVLAYAGERTRRSNALRPAGPETPERRAAEALRALGRRLAVHGALATVRDTWPAPIAHELLRLVDDLADRPGPDGARLPPRPEPALVQLRDAGEVLIKVSAAVLLQALIAAGGETGRWARAAVFQFNNGTGQWVGLLREAAKRVRAGLPEGPIRAFAGLAERSLCPFADGLVEFRNQVIGHGLRTLDPEDTARQVVGLIEEGCFVGGDGQPRKIQSLTTTLAAMTKADAFAGWTLRARDGEVSIALVGAAATSDWLADPRHAEGHHQDHTLPLALDLPDGTTLDLTPLLAAFLAGRAGGVWWLQAPAHVGKTTWWGARRQARGRRGPVTATTSKAPAPVVQAFR